MTVAALGVELPVWTPRWTIGALGAAALLALVLIWRGRGSVADRCAQSTFVLVLLAGVPLAAGADIRATYDALRDENAAAATSTVTKSTTTAGGTSREQSVTETPAQTQTVDKTTTAPSASINERTVTQTPANQQTTSKDVTTPDAEVVETIVSDVDQSVLERSLSPASLLLLRFAAVVLVAFLAAAAVQRVLLGQYQLKVGQLEIPVVTRAKVEAAVKKLGRSYRVRATAEAAAPAPEFVWVREPRAKFLAFYVELQHRIRRLAVRGGLDGDRPASLLLADLNAHGVLSAAEVAGLLALLRFGEAVADGAAVDDDALQWLDSEEGGLAVLYHLDTTRLSSLEVELRLRRRKDVEGIGEVYAVSETPVVRPRERVMIDMHVRNTGPVDVSFELVDAATALVLAEASEPLPPGAAVAVTHVTDVPSSIEGAWAFDVRARWIDQHGLPGTADAMLTCRVAPVPAWS